MRRIFTKKPPQSKKDELKQSVMEQLRQAREKINKDHPGLLKKIQKMNETQSGMGETAPQIPDTHVDKQKNMTTILKCLEEKADNPGFQTAVKAMLLRHQH